MALERRLAHVQKNLAQRVENYRQFQRGTPSIRRSRDLSGANIQRRNPARSAAIC
jgi:hypothetical protein